MSDQVSNRTFHVYPGDSLTDTMKRTQPGDTIVLHGGRHQIGNHEVPGVNIIGFFEELRVRQSVKQAVVNLIKAVYYAVAERFRR